MCPWMFAFTFLNNSYNACVTELTHIPFRSFQSPLSIWLVLRCLKMFLGGDTFFVQMVNKPLVCVHSLSFCSILHGINKLLYFRLFWIGPWCTWCLDIVIPGYFQFGWCKQCPWLSKFLQKGPFASWDFRIHMCLYIYFTL